jgi:4-carboxymuconolactone decarboxylase
MTRIPALSPGDLSEHGRRVYDELMASRGEVDRPYQILMSSPELLRRVAHVGWFLRFESSLPAPIRECIILATGRELRCQFEWTSHEPQARRAGVSDESIRSIRNGELPSGPGGEEAVVRFVYENLRNGEVTDATFRRVRDAFGDAGTAEVAATIGFYSMLANVINAFGPNEWPADAGKRGG